MHFLNKYFFIIVILAVSLFLRTYKLPEYMQFIPDQGWFYLSARDMLLSGNIPLVGLETSHPWIHHGALWTYTLGIILWLFNFNPVIPAYFIAILGLITVGLFYFVVKKMYSDKIALISSILYATSPLIVMNSRLPYHTSPIPFFTILLFFSTYLWLKGKVWMFPFITFLLAVLYNHEITTFVYVVCIFVILFFGALTKKKWIQKLKDIKIIAISLIGFIIPMIPFIIYDIFYNGKQTVWFLIWMIYRVVKLPLSIVNDSFASSGSNPSTFSEFFYYYQNVMVSHSFVFSFLLLFLTCMGILYLIVKNKILKNVFSKKVLMNTFPMEYVLVALFLGVGFLGLLIHRVPIEADTLLIVPFIIILTVIVFFEVIKNYYLLLFTAILIGFWNSYILLSTNYFTAELGGNRPTHIERMEAISKVIELSEDKSYMIEGKGELSDFPVFTMPYEYLLWWKGHPISHNFEKKIIIWEHSGKIEVYEEN